MKPALWSRLDIIARRVTPFGLTVLLVLFNILPMQIPGLSRVMPLFPLMSIYIWAVHRPGLLPAYAVFLIGFLQDTLIGTPIGLHIVTYLLVYGTVVWQRRFLAGKPFAVIWVGFSLVAAGATIANWIVLSLFYLEAIQIDSLVFQYLLSLGVFPILSWFFMRWQFAFLTDLGE